MGVRHDARTQLSMLHPSRRHALTQREKYVAGGGATGSFSFATSPDSFFFRRPNLDATWQNGAKKRE